MNERFSNEVGCHYNPEYLCNLSDEELAAEIRDLPEWDDDLLRELCYRGDTLDKYLEAEEPDCPAIHEAAEKLGVEI